VIDSQTFGFMVSDIARMTRALLERRIAAAGLGITPGEARALLYIAAQEGERQTRIAERMGIEPMTACTYIDKLEKQGLVARGPTRGTAAPSRSSPPKPRKTSIEAITAETAAMREDILDGLPREERETMLAGLRMHVPICRPCWRRKQRRRTHHDGPDHEHSAHDADLVHPCRARADLHGALHAGHAASGRGVPRRPAVIKATLTAYFAGFAFSSCSPGLSLTPSDGASRRSFFISIYILGSVAAALAPTVDILMAARLVQGIGASIGVTVARHRARSLPRRPGRQDHEHGRHHSGHRPGHVTGYRRHHR
jgi:MarR family transcriptional regulator for hemolysin